jgi:hypothetical protein
MTTKVLNELKVLIPPKDLLINYEAAISSLYEFSDEMKEEILNLTSLRDFLLRKLISGELEVQEVIANSYV